MGLVKVIYRLRVGKITFRKELKVFSVPLSGSLLKAANNSFVVTESEQDLDGYDLLESMGQYNLSTCEYVVAIPNPKMYGESDFSKIAQDLRNEGWKERTA